MLLLDNATVAELVLLLNDVLTAPLLAPLSILNVVVVPGYVTVPLVGVNVIVHVPRFTVNAYDAEQLL